MNWSELNKAVVDEFRLNAGRVARFSDLPIVILHTVGAKTQKILEVPLIAILKDERMLLFATAAGSPRHPSWYYNLRAYPEIDVEFGSDRFKARITQLPEKEAQVIVQQQAETSEQLVQYLESAGGRIIPVFTIDRV